MMASQKDGGWLGPHRIHGLVNDRYPSHFGQGESEITHPMVRDRVRIEGQDEIFFIVYVDVRRRVVDLVCGERVGFLNNIPYSAVRPAAPRQSNR